MRCTQIDEVFKVLDLSLWDIIVEVCSLSRVIIIGRMVVVRREQEVIIPLT